jgi:hypothetical protein
MDEEARYIFSDMRRLANYNRKNLVSMLSPDIYECH